MTDILGQALHNYYYNHATAKLWIGNKYGIDEEMPLAAYFRGEDDMPDLEWLALEQCRGKVLDIGAGAGSHSLILQQRGFKVTAMDISPMAVEVMHERGVKQTLQADIFTYNQSRFDTLLLLMNGIGLAGTLDGLKQLLAHLKTLLNPGGQILFDSSDISYLYEGELPADKYYGELQYQYKYKKLKTDWFGWLYIDEYTLHKVVTELGYTIEVLLEDEFRQYLVKLTL